MNAAKINDNEYVLVDAQGRQWSISRVIEVNGTFFDIDPDVPDEGQVSWRDGAGKFVWVARVWAGPNTLATAMFDETSCRYRSYDTAQAAIDAVRAAHGGAS